MQREEREKKQRANEQEACDVSLLLVAFCSVLMVRKSDSATSYSATYSLK